MERNREGRTGRARVLLYSHDTYGLGHLRRSLLISGSLASSPRVGPVLIVTGSPRAQAFRLPPGCDTVKLPSVTKTSGGVYRARTLSLSMQGVIRVRSALVKTAMEAFRPDLILVDHAPLGMLGELGPLLEVARRRRRARLVLGLRDVIDDPAAVDAEWSRLGAWPALETAYDLILVYGDSSVTTTAQELGLADRLPGKVTHVGYLGRPIRRDGPPSDPMILVTAGGGGDGQDVVRAYAAYLESLPSPAPFRSVVVTGPLMSRRRRQELTMRFRGLSHPVELVAFTDRMDELLAAASGVVSMAGYNTVVEVLSADIPALLVPRERPRLEQRIRAERVAARVPAVEWCRAPECTPDRIAGFVERALAYGGSEERWVELDGVDAVAVELLDLLGGARRVAGKERLRVPA